MNQAPYGAARRSMMPHHPARLILLAVVMVMLLATRSDLLQASSHILYVDQSATGAADGSSWANAFTNLQPALVAATAGDEIWVAAGTYTPTEPTDTSDPHTVTFQLKNGVAVYGGFDGSETARDQRDWEANETILSGDIDGNDNDNVASDEPTRQDNSYHVVTGSSTDSTAILDGFTVSGGNASHTDYPQYSGGGMYNNGGHPTVTNVIFTGNSATNSGGGMLNDSGHPTLTNVTFQGNTAESASSGGFGGGMLNLNSNATLIDVTFRGNSASNSSGGMYNYYSSPTLSTVTFRGNSAGTNGGGMVNVINSNPTLTNVTFRDNSAGTNGGGMVNNDNSSPTLTNVIFSGNSAGILGGGIYNQLNSNPALTNVTVRGNSASHTGGGMYNRASSNPTLSNVAFSGNSARYYGGGMYNNDNSSPVLTNATFSGNSAGTDGGGMYNMDSDPEIYNSIFWQNRDSTGTGTNAQIGNDSSTATVRDSLVQGGCSTASDCTDVTNNDPQFVRDPDDGGDGWGVGGNDDFGDLHLQPNSPALDRGDNGHLPADTTDLDGDGDTTETIPYDLDGTPRLVDHPDVGTEGSATVDLGAYEVMLADPLLTQTVDPTEAEPGETVTVRLHFTNSGTAAAASVVLTDAIPAELADIAISYDGTTPSLTGESPHTWEIAELAPGAGGTIIIEGVLREGLAGGTTITNSATISTTSEEIDAGNNQDEVTLTVQNAAPVAADDSATTPQDTAIPITILDNDSDANGDTLSISAVGTPANGSATIEGNQIRYTPASGFSGTDSFTYTVSDGELTDQATLTVEVQEGEAQPGGETRLFLPAVSR